MGEEIIMSAHGAVEPSAGQPSDKLSLARASDEFLATAPDNMLCVARDSAVGSRIKFDGATERNQKDSEVMKSRIAICREMYENVGIIGNVVDLMVDFAIEGFSISHPNKPIERFFANWAKKVRLYDTVEQMLKCMYRDGNVPVLAIRGKLDQEEVTSFKRTISSADEKTTGSTIANPDPFLKVSISEKGDRVIPVAYSVLDVLKVNITGSALLGNLTFEYMIAADALDSLRSPKNPQEKERAALLEKQLGKDAYATLKDGGVITLPQDRLSMLYYKKDEFQRWANPMLWRVVDDVKFKKLLRDMDISVAESVCNVLTFIKLGKVAEGFPAPAAKYTKLANMLKNPSKSKIIIWDDLIDIKSEFPPVDKILGVEKYKQVNDDIRSGLGIAEILVNGQGGNYSNSYLSVKTLLERLETGRQHIMEWLEAQVNAVALGMGFRKPASVKMRHMSLTDEAAAKQIILELYDRNLISAQTALEYMDEDPEVEIPRMQEEDDFRKANKKAYPFVLLKTGKYGPQHVNGVVPIGMFAADPNTVLEAKTAPKGAPTAQGPAGQQGGRPAGTNKPQQKQRLTEPKGQTPKSRGSEDLPEITINPEYLARGESICDELAKTFETQDDEIYAEAAIKILCNIKDDQTLGDAVEAMVKQPDFFTSAPAKLERCVREVTNKKVADFRAKNGRAPNKKERNAMISSAWAICRSSLGM